MDHLSRSAGEAELDSKLDDWFHSYRESCPEPEAGSAFMPELWAKIEARETSSNVFGRMARALVTVALAATVVLGILLSSAGSTGAISNGTYLDALTDEHVASLEPLHLDRISEMEQQ